MPAPVLSEAREELRQRGCRVYYREIDDRQNAGSFAEELKQWSERLKPSRLIVVEPVPILIFLDSSPDFQGSRSSKTYWMHLFGR